MSLLEDLVHLMRCVLEYFGVPQELLVPVWESALCGQYRSIVRMIGSNLPLTPCPRLHFQVPLRTISRHGHIEVSVDGPAIPTLADVLWVAEDEGERCTKFRNTVSLRKQRWSHAFENPTAVCVRPIPAALREQKFDQAQTLRTQPEAFEKIQALEAELLKLRAQIAMIVITPTADTSLPNNPSTPCSHFPAPVLTSTPFTAPPPPPPLPPLPPPPHVGPEQGSVMDVIRQRQASRKGKAEVRKASPAAVPSMLEVLKDLNQVKLRTVERSPGGTPVRKRRSKGTTCASDPAALIAEALKRKFAHRQRDASFDKENRSAELSPFSSPDTPRIPLVTRRSQGRNHSSPLTRRSDGKQNDGK